MKTLNYKSFFALTILLLLLKINLSNAVEGLTGIFSLSGIYDSNPLLLNNQNQDVLTNAAFTLEYSPEYTGFNIGYSGSVLSFSKNPERNYNFHSLFSKYKFQLFDYEYLEAEIKFNAFLRNNSKDSREYNYSGLSPELNLIFYTDAGIITTGYIPSLSMYENYNLLNNFSNKFKASLNKTFESETNLKATVSFSTANYYNADSSESIQNTKKKKYHRFLNPTEYNLKPNSVFESNINSIFDFNLEVNQQITDEFSLGIEGNANFHTSRDGLYYAAGKIDLYNGRPFYDDINNFEEKGVEIKSKYKASDLVNFESSAKFFKRDFMYSGFLINSKYSDEIYRADDGVLLKFKMKCEFFPNILFFEVISLETKIEYLVNNSNIREYNFSDAGFTVILNFYIWDSGIRID